MRTWRVNADFSRELVDLPRSRETPFSWLRKQIDDLPGDSHWQTLAKAGLREDVSHLQTELARKKEMN
jgi:hypothetical protein